MRLIQHFLLIGFVILIYGCKSTPIVPTADTSNAQIYLDEHFNSDVILETPEQIFAVTPAMSRYVQKRLSHQKTPRERTKRMLRDLFDPEVLNIQYLNSANITASEAFDSGLANCLSLTILSYVLAEQAGLKTEFMDVEVEENWTYADGYSLLNGHVNLRVTGFSRNDTQNIERIQRVLTIDFLPMLNAKPLRSKVLNKQQIVALYYNNKGAEALINGDFDTAYQYFKQATVLAPKLASNWTNLGSLYRRSGFYQEAERVYNIGLKLEPENLNTKESLAILYEKTGRKELAAKLKSDIENRRLKNPNYHAMLANESYREGSYGESIRKYKRALKLQPNQHQFMFGLARNYLMLGDYDRANAYLKKAKSLADQHQDKRTYQNKIDILSSLSARRM